MAAFSNEKNADDSVVDYLLEIEDLKEKIRECVDATFVEQTENKRLKREEYKNGKAISNLETTLENQEDEIRKLENSLLVALERNPNEDSNLIRDPEEINLDTIMARSVFIRKDLEQAKQEGRRDNIEMRLCQVRKMFNDCLRHLKELEKNNQIVSKCLHALKDLDVRKYGFIESIDLNFSLSGIRTYASKNEVNKIA